MLQLNYLTTCQMWAGWMCMRTSRLSRRFNKMTECDRNQRESCWFSPSLKTATHQKHWIHDASSVTSKREVTVKPCFFTQSADGETVFGVCLFLISHQFLQKEECMCGCVCVCVLNLARESNCVNSPRVQGGVRCTACRKRNTLQSAVWKSTKGGALNVNIILFLPPFNHPAWDTFTRNYQEIAGRYCFLSSPTAPSPHHHE